VPELDAADQLLAGELPPTKAFQDAMKLLRFVQDQKWDLERLESMARWVAVTRHSPVLGYRHLLIVAGARRQRTRTEA